MVEQVNPAENRPPERVAVPPRPAVAAAPAADPMINAVQRAMRGAAAGGMPQPAFPAPPLAAPAAMQYNPSQPVPYPYQYAAAPMVGMQPNAVVPPGAVGSLLAAVLNQQRDVGSKFFMILVPDTDPPSVQGFNTVEELQAAVKPMLGTSTYVHCFLGHQLRITKGQFPTLQTPYGHVPLYDPPAVAGEIIDDGWLGVDPPQAAYQPPSEQAMPEEEEEEEITDFDEDDPDDGSELFG